jgi:hypothetical protein
MNVVQRNIGLGESFVCAAHRTQFIYFPMSSALNIKVGQQGEATGIVTSNNTAKALGSGTLLVRLFFFLGFLFELFFFSQLKVLVHQIAFFRERCLGRRRCLR